MWQRIQTVFLVVLIIALLVSLIQPIWSFQSEEGSTLLTPFYFLKDGNYIYMPYTGAAMLAIASVTLAITSIRSYKNRVLQMKLGALNSIVLVLVVGLSVYFGNALIEEYQGGKYGLGLYLPGVAVVCNLLANFFIRKDERLVRDSDRLR